MASPIRAPELPRDAGGREAPAQVARLPRARNEPEGVLESLTRLARLQVELGVSETRERLKVAAVAAGVAIAGAIAAVASVVVLIAGALAPLFDAAWQHLIVAGGGVLVVSLAAILWGVSRIRNLEWPQETLESLRENWSWLTSQARSTLTLRRNAA